MIYTAVGLEQSDFKSDDDMQSLSQNNGNLFKRLFLSRHCRVKIHYIVSETNVMFTIPKLWSYLWVSVF